MKKRLCVAIAAALMLASVVLPILSSVPTIAARREVGHRAGHAQVTRQVDKMACQSGTACGG